MPQNMPHLGLYIQKNIQPSYDKLLNLQPTVHLDVSIKDIILFTHLSLSLSLSLWVASKALFYNILWCCYIILLCCMEK